MRPHELLVIDDDAALRYSLRKSLESPTLTVREAATAEAGLAALREAPPDAVLLDLRLQEASGIDVLRAIRQEDAGLPVLMFTAYSTTTSAIEATKFGAFDYLLKPVDLAVLSEAVGRALASRGEASARRSRPDEASYRPGGDVNMVGTSPAMQEVYKLIGRFAPTNGNVLILGESGTGKELVAQAVHHHSKRRSGQFLAINCATLSETLLESELFGHEKGAFTGADRRRVGKFEYANGGTIFLDEVADMSPATQAKLLRLLQDQRFERLGANETITTDVRLVAATNKNLEAMVAQGKFREDLYYRLNVFCIRLPPLRERREDLPALADWFAACYKEEFDKLWVELDPSVYRLLVAYHWPGNMRELQSAIKHALAHAPGNLLRPEHLPPPVQAGGRAVAGRSEDALGRLVERLLATGSRNVYGAVVAQVERLVLPRVLAHTRGNLQHACECLGISRNTLKAKMRDHAISVERTVLSNSDGADPALTGED